jgi:hypothetical protein
MEAVQERSSSPGVEEIETSNTEHLLYRSQRKRGQAATRFGNLQNLGGKDFPRPHQPNASNGEQDDAPRAGVEAKTPSKIRMNSHPFPQSSLSPRQDHVRRKLNTPAAAGALELFKESSLDGSQQPVPTFESRALWPESSVEDVKSVPESATDNTPSGTRRQSTSAQTLADLNCALDKSLFWKPSKSSTQSPLGEFLCRKKGDENESKGWLRRGLGLRSKGYLAKEETKILTVMYLSLSGTTPWAARELAFAWGQSEQTMRSASKKYLQILMTKEPPAPSIDETIYRTKPSVVEIGCQTEPAVVDIGCQNEPSVVEIECQTKQTTLGASSVDGGCQTVSCDPVDTECQTEVSLLLTGSEHAQTLAFDVIMTRIKDASNGIFSLLSKDFHVNQFLKLPKPRPSKGDRSGPVNKVTKLLKAAIAVLCINPEEELKVAERLVSSYDNILLSKSDDNISQP